MCLHLTPALTVCIFSYQNQFTSIISQLILIIFHCCSEMDWRINFQQEVGPDRMHKRWEAEIVRLIRKWGRGWDWGRSLDWLGLWEDGNVMLMFVVVTLADTGWRWGTWGAGHSSASDRAQYTRLVWPQQLTSNQAPSFSLSEQNLKYFHPLCLSGLWYAAL